MYAVGIRPPGRPSTSVLRPSTHPKVNATTADDRHHQNQLIVLSAQTVSQKRADKQKDDRLNIPPWSTAHARPAPPPSVFYLDLIILFVIIVDVSVHVRSPEKSPRCARKRLCRPHARGYIRTKRTGPIRSATLRSSRLFVLSPYAASSPPFFLLK